VKGSLVVMDGRITSAMPVNVACLPPGVVQEVPGLLITSPSIDWAFMRTSA
jgi:hypothetical protein